MSAGSPVHERLAELEHENAELRERLRQIEVREAKLTESRAKLMRGGFRLLVPLFDRQKVVRSFGKLMETASGFSGPPAEWPAREELLGDTRMFLEAVVRFVIRRRLFILMFALLGAAIPAIQVWLVVQQNEIIENQNEFFEIQVYDVVARSMTEGDRNARLMTGALLANADPEFLASVVSESFDPSLASVYRADGVNSAARRLDDAAYRGHLIRAAVRSIETQRQRSSIGTTYVNAKPMLKLIVADASARIPEVMRLGQNAQDAEGDREEQVDHYIVQVGQAIRSYSRFARARGELDSFGRHLAPLLHRMSQRSVAPDNRFAAAYRTMLQDVLFELAAKLQPGAPPVDVGALSAEPNQQLRAGLNELKSLTDGAVNWNNIATQAGIR